MKEIESDNLVACLASSGKGLEEIVGISRELSKGPEFILLLDAGKAQPERLLPAYLNSYLRYSESCLKAKSLQMETLLFAAGTLRLDKAIKEYGAKNNKRFMVFASSGRLLEAFRKKAGIRITKRCNLVFDADVAVKVASVGLVED